MRNSVLITACLLTALLFAGCRDPYFAARSTILIGRGAVAMSQTGFDTYVQVETEKCNNQCKTDPACLDKCLAPVKANTVIFQKSKLTAQALLDESDALVNVAEKLKKSEPVDWLVPIKGFACLMARSLDFLNPETKKKIQGLIDIMGSFGCPAKTP